MLTDDSHMLLDCSRRSVSMRKPSRPDFSLLSNHTTRFLNGGPTTGVWTAARIQAIASPLPNSATALSVLPSAAYPNDNVDASSELNRRHQQDEGSLEGTAWRLGKGWFFQLIGSLPATSYGYIYFRFKRH